MEIETEINYGGLKKLVQAMSKQYSVKVGLLADKGGSDEVSENMDMAGLGALMEYGADIKITKKMAAFLNIKAKELGLPAKEGKGDGYVHIPARSWLQMPLQKREALKKKIIEHFGGEGKESIEAYITESGDLKSLAIMLGVSAVEQIQEAFDTSGFGEWKENSPFTIADKGSAMPLIGKGKDNEASGALRNRITYEVSDNG